MKSTVAIAVLALVASLSACGGTSDDGKDDGPNYDRDAVAKKVQSAQQAAVPDLEVSAAKCPKKVKVAKGTTFECTIDVAGVTAPYTVKITSVKSSKANFSFSPAKAIISVEKTVAFVQQQATAQGFKGVTVDCGKAAVVVQDPGTTFPCTLTRGTQKQTVRIQIKDKTGRIAISG